MNLKSLFLIFLNISLINSIALRNNDFFTMEIRNLIKKINRLSLSKSNEVLMNILLERLKYYIINHDISRPDLPKEKYKNIIQMKANFTSDEDGTYDLYSHEKIEFDRGFHASFETKYDPYNENEIINLVYKLSLMTDNKVYLGIYAGDPEFSFYFDDYELANAICILFNQISMWDWRIKQEIVNIYYKEFA